METTTRNALNTCSNVKVDCIRGILREYVLIVQRIVQWRTTGNLPLDLEKGFYWFIAF